VDVWRTVRNKQLLREKEGTFGLRRVCRPSRQTDNADTRIQIFEDRHSE
jgi:hypothetical protein